MDDLTNLLSVYDKSFGKSNGYNKFHYLEKEQCILNNFKPRN